MALYFITGNANKLREAQAVLPEVEQLDIELPEIQDVNAHEIIKAKLGEAQKHHRGRFIVEDTSLYLKGMNGLPGPLIKWFLKTVGNEGIARLAHDFGDEAEAKTVVGYSDDAGGTEFFEGSVKGRIVEPRGGTNFGWDPVFLPDGFDKTFAEMDAEQKNSISMRRLALNRLKVFLG